MSSVAGIVGGLTDQRQWRHNQKRPADARGWLRLQFLQESRSLNSLQASIGTRSDSEGFIQGLVFSNIGMNKVTFLRERGTRICQQIESLPSTNS
jgi:hypothetical protein